MTDASREPSKRQTELTETEEQSEKTSKTKPSKPTSDSTSTSEEETSPTSSPPLPQLFSSYARLLSFEPASGKADLVYFDMLKGEAAINYLINTEGYEEAQAREEVENYADSEFIEVQTDQEIRSVIIDQIKLSLMYDAQGNYHEMGPQPATAADFRDLFQLEPQLITNSFFFYLHVDSSGKAEHLEQVYWP